MQKTVVVVFVDAFGTKQWSQLEATWQGAFPYRRQLKGVLGYSCAALPTILTGTPPSQHGRMCLFSQARRDGDTPLAALSWLGLLPRPLADRGAVRRLVARALRTQSGLTGYLDLYRIPARHFNWLDVPEKQDLFTASTIGGRSTFLHEARTAGLRVFHTPWQIEEDARFDLASAVLSSHPPDLAFVYSTQLDSVMHRHGTHHPDVRLALESLARRLDTLVAAVRAGGREPEVLVVGDHGMADVTNHIDPRPVLSGLATRAFVDSTMIRFWGGRSMIGAARGKVDDAGWSGRWVSAETAPDSALASPRQPFGDAVFVLEEGSMFVPSFLGGAVRGMHGYAPSSSSAQAALISTDAIPQHVQGIQDVASLIRASLGLPAGDSVVGSTSPATQTRQEYRSRLIA